jgi:hypothetical protein
MEDRIWLTHWHLSGAQINSAKNGTSPKVQDRLDVPGFEITKTFTGSIWSVPCSYSQAKGRKGVTMDFAIILIVSNTLLAGFIYFVVTRIWQD